MPILGHRVTLRPEGPDAESLAAAEERISIDGTPVAAAPGRPTRCSLSARWPW